jgi:ADP-heptose:LPS heptosyltransferase
MYLVDALKSAQRDSHITWLVEPACAGILKLHPRIDEIVVFERARGLRGVLNLRQELAARSFDITLDLQRHAKSGLFSWLSGSQRRIGFHRNDAKECNWIFNTEFVAPQGESISKIDHYLTFLDPLGLPRPIQLSAGLDGITLQSLGAAWSASLDRPYMACILGSSWDSKDWPVEGYEGLLNAMPGSCVVLLSDKSKVDLAARLEKVPSKATVINLAGKTNLSELVAVIRGARVCVGPDSGPGHIAGAVGTPHITLFGPTPSVRNAPRGSEALAIASNVGCSPCKRRVCPGLNKICMRMISPQAVLEQAARFLS